MDYIPARDPGAVEEEVIDAEVFDIEEAVLSKVRPPSLNSHPNQIWILHTVWLTDGDWKTKMMDEQKIHENPTSYKIMSKEHFSMVWSMVYESTCSLFF